MALGNRRIAIGVDGGGTKTAAVLYADDGTVLSRGTFPGTNPHATSREAVSAAFRDLVSTLLRDGGATVEQLDTACLGMAGADRPADQALIEELFRPNVLPTTPVTIVNDAIVAMVAVLGKLDGILVIAGTGSICYGFNGAAGTSARAGGWGHLLADEGAGYAIGLAAAKAVMHAHDHRTPPTALTGKVLAQLGKTSPTDLVGWIYLSGAGKAEVAALAPLVHEADSEGDPIAAAILDAQAKEVASLVPAVYRRLFSGEPTFLALWGSNLVKVDRYRERFMAAVASYSLPVTPVVKDAEATIGAARHGLNLLAPR